jgi:hypothetical protein
MACCLLYLYQNLITFYSHKCRYSSKRRKTILLFLQEPTGSLQRNPNNSHEIQMRNQKQNMVNRKRDFLHN